MLEFKIKPGYARWMAVMTLSSFGQFMTRPVGERLDAGRNGRELRRIPVKLDGRQGIFYLKRMGREPVHKLLQMVLFGHRPHCGPFREQQMLARLNAAGFATMQPAAYGERRRFGWPLEGFLLVEEVAGIEVADHYRSCDPAERRRLVAALGEYLGQLHLAGFFQPVRLKDVFLQSGSCSSRPYRFVLIDRETSKPWPTRFGQQRCLETLARAARRTRRDGHVIGRQEVRAFCRGYHPVVGKELGLTEADFRSRLLRAYRRQIQRPGR